MKDFCLRYINCFIALVIIFPLFFYFLAPQYSGSLIIENFFGYGEFNYEFTANDVMNILSYVLIFVVASVGLNVQVGLTGQLNLGYAAFMAIGAYAAALFQEAHPELYAHYPIIGMCCSLLLAAFAAAVVGVLVCFPTLKMRGDYFAIVTFGFAEVVRLVIKNEPGLGGAMGINNLFLFPTESLDSFKEKYIKNLLSEEAYAAFQLDAWLQYFIFIIFTGLVIYLVTQLRDSHMGRCFLALRENERAAQACGISITYTKFYSFLISAAIGGVAGYMIVIRNAQAHPGSFVFMISIYAICALVLGGMGSIRGAVVGALALMSLGEILREILIAMPKNADHLPLIPPEGRIILFGLVLILMMRFRPNGLISLESDTLRLAGREDNNGDASVYYTRNEDE